MRTLAIVNQKGGCGKTTTAINLGAVFAARGRKTLVVDMDPQSHCAAGLGVPESQIEYSMADALTAEHGPAFDSSQLIWEVSRHLDLAPSTMRLAALEAPGGGLHHLHDKDRRLTTLLETLAPRYDICLIDCPPTIGMLTFNVLRAAREALIPVETGYFSLKGAQKQWGTIQRIIQHIGRPIACHLLPSLHKRHSRTANDVLGAMRREFAGQILPVVINEHESLREAASYGQPIVEHAPDSEARREFEALADWLEDHLAHPVVEVEVLPGAYDSLSRGQATDAEMLQQEFGGRDGVAAAVGASGGLPGQGGRRAAELVARVQRLAAAATRRNVELEADLARQLQEQARESLMPRPQPVPISRQITAAVMPVMHDRRTHPSAAAVAPGPAPPPPAPAIPLRVEAPEAPEVPPQPAAPPRRPAHLYGVRETASGVLFVQPGEPHQSIAIAGDFNQWSAASTPLYYSPELGAHQAIVDLPPGSYRYRLVIDGKWQADPHNERQHTNRYGELINIIEVKEEQAPV